MLLWCGTATTSCPTDSQHIFVVPFAAGLQSVSSPPGLFWPLKSINELLFTLKILLLILKPDPVPRIKYAPHTGRERLRDVYVVEISNHVISILRYQNWDMEYTIQLISASMGLGMLGSQL